LSAPTQPEGNGDLQAAANQDGEVKAPPVERRRVLHCGGFELVAPELLDRRLASGMEKFPPLWCIAASRLEPNLSDDGAVMTWDVAATGANWATATRFATLRWDDLVEPYVRRSLLLRLPKGYVALTRFLLNGTIRRYFGLAPRYGNFSLFPFVVLLGAVLIGLLVSGIARVLGLLPYAPVTALVVWAAVSIGLLYGLANSIYLDFSLDHWAFAEALAQRKVRGLDAILDRFAREIVAAVVAEDADEVIVSGTSLGAVMAVEAVARALAIEPELFRRGKRVALLTTGSSLLQVGLHPAAKGLRDAVLRVAEESGLFWLEIQTTVDPVNFCNTDPVKDLGLVAARSPVVRVFRLRDLMTEDAYQRIHYNHIRLHRQYVMPNGKRHYYDFYMICFGPMPLTLRTELAEGTLSHFGEDGSYHDSAKRGRQKKGALASRPGIG
jgi:hypothetical protein